MTQTSSEYWKDDVPVRAYLDLVRDAVPLKAQQHDIMLRFLRALDRPIYRILDLGCGDGLLGHLALDAFPEAHGVFADLSATMLEEARGRLRPHDARCEFVACDYSAPAWVAQVGNGFDAVLSGYSIHHQPDARKREVYAEILTLLEPGGLFLNIEHVASPTPWVEARHDDYFIDSLHAHALRRDPASTWQAMRDLYRERRDHGANQLAPAERQCDWLRELGYADVDIYFKVFELAIFGGRRRP